MKNKLVSFLLIVAILIIAIPSFAQTGDSILAPDSLLTPTEDVWVYRLQPDSNYDSGSSESGSGLLILSHDGGIDGNSEQANRYAFLKFNLENEDSGITNVSFLLSSIIDGCVGEGSDAVALEVFGITNDNWSESSLTWNISENDLMPTATNTLATLKNSVLDSVGYNELIGSDLAAFLETERNGDGIATIGIRIADGYPNQDAFFEDRENTGAEANCGQIDGGPLLLLLSSPTAVSLSNSNAISASLDSVLLPIVLFIVGMLGLMIIKQNQRRKSLALAKQQRQSQQENHPYNY